MLAQRLRESPAWAYRLWKSPISLENQLIKQFSSSPDAFGAPPTPPFRRVVVTGIGLVIPLGVGTARVWDRLLAGDTAVRALTEEDLPPDHRAAFPALPSKVIACVPRVELSNLPGSDPRREAPFMTYALLAASEALRDAGWAPTTLEERRFTGVAIGAGMSCTTDMAEAGALLQGGKLRRLSPFFVPRTLVNMASGAVSMAHGLQGPNHAASTACASGAHGVGDAFHFIQRGAAEAMLAGGAEACVDAIALAGFSRLKALSTRFNDAPQAASRPFDRDRDGFVMGEGAAVLLLEELGRAQTRGARIYAEIRGYGLSGDAHHITQPPADGAGAQLAMRRALAAAGVAPRDVSYVNAHATSTPIGDDVEQRALAEVFGTATEAASGPLISSTKGAVGHLLGAAGAVEAAFSALAVSTGWAPPNCNLEHAEPAGLLPGLMGREAVELGPAHTRVAVSNSFGFGGTNASLVFGPPPL